jgi:hypothetical protein
MWLLAPFRLIQRTACRFQDEHFVQTAAALSFATLVGLVPMIAAAFALISLLPVGVGLGSAQRSFCSPTCCRTRPASSSPNTSASLRRAPDR